MAEEVTFDRYELRSGSNSFKETHLLEEVEAATPEDVRRHIEETRPGELVWVVNRTKKTPPYAHVPVRIS
jgi:hypothetical protein